MTKPLPLLVFSDLDGTLLDHRTYSWQLARPGLDRLHSLGAGLVLASSKTASEIEPLRLELGFPDCPSIVENGAGILWPDEPSISDNSDYQRIVQLLSEMQEGFRGFSSMSTNEVADLTGLSLEGAERARQRCFSEPGLWQRSEAELDHFLQALREQGLMAVQGGRFLSISLGKTKAMAMAEIVEKLSPAKTIALGDAPNDIDMIEQADRGVIIANPSTSALPALVSEKEGRTIRTVLEGPEGWAAAILSLTSDLQVLKDN